jgi:hypothetical protein
MNTIQIIIVIEKPKMPSTTCTYPQDCRCIQRSLQKLYRKPGEARQQVGSRVEISQNSSPKLRASSIMNSWDYRVVSILQNIPPRNISVNSGEKISLIDIIGWLGKRR